VLSGVRLPRVRGAGTLRGQILEANVLVEDPRGTARVAVGLRPSRTGPKVDVNAVLRVADLARTSQRVVQGEGVAFAEGTIDLAELRVNGQVAVSAKDVSTGDVRVARAYASSVLEGTLENPGYDGAVALERIGVGERRFRKAVGRVRGTLDRSFFEALFEGESRAPSAAMRGEASMDRGLTIRDLSVTGHRGGVTVLAGASLVRVRSGEVRLDDVAALGLGEPIHASIVATRRLTEVMTLAPRVDLQRLARVVGLDPKRLSGESGADIDIRATPEETTGHLDVELRKAVLGREAFGQGRLQAKFEGRRIDAEAHGDWNGGQIDLRAKGLEIDGPPLELESWARARGAVDFASDIDLTHVGALMPPNVLPFDEVDGRAGVRVRFERDQSNAAPTIGLAVKTKGLKLSRNEVEGQQDSKFVVRSPSPWHVEGMDIDADLLIDPAGNRTDVKATVFDRRGTIVTVAFDSAAPSFDLVRRPEEIRSFFERTPLHLSVHVPKRRFSELPMPLARPAVRGSVEFRADASGLLRAPTIDASLVVDGLASRQSGNAPPFDGRFTAHFSGDEASVEGAVTRAGSVVARAKARGHVPFAEVLAGDVRHFDVAGEAHLDELPFQSLAVLAAERVRGRLSGKVSATFGTEVSPRLQADLRADDVSIGRARHNQFTLSVDADRDTLRAFARVKETDGSADVRATLPIAFPFAEPSQVPPASRPGEITFNARRFHLALLRPLAEGVVSELDGHVDGKVTIAVRDGGRQTSMTGGIRLTDGALGVPVLGEEFSAIAANVRLDGDNVSVDDFHAEGTTGEVNGSASFHVSGYTIDRATASVKIPKGDPLPIEHEGEALADVWGQFDATLVRKNGSPPEIKVAVSKAGVLLPSLSSHALQPLEPAERVRIGFMRRDGRFEIVRGMSSSETEGPEEEGMTIRIVAKDVEVRRGTDLRVRLDGEPVVKTGRDEGVYGGITLRSGYLYVQGKKFEIEKGVITFDGEADNPNVVVTAAYAAPEDTRIYADFVGPLKTGKLTLRSDPPHTKSEILSLILFGTTTGNVAPPSGSGSGSAAAAAGIGGGFAAQGLTRAIDDLIGIDVTARVDTTRSANPRPEVEVRVARDVSVSVAHVLGVPPPGSNPDRNLARIDFRLLRNWSLQTIVGDQGSTLFDLVWQYRY
jgi:translocation and assembly module TamB